MKVKVNLTLITNELYLVIKCDRLVEWIFFPISNNENSRTIDGVFISDATFSYNTACSEQYLWQLANLCIVVGNICIYSVYSTILSHKTRVSSLMY